MSLCNSKSIVRARKQNPVFLLDIRAKFHNFKPYKTQQPPRLSYRMITDKFEPQFFTTWNETLVPFTMLSAWTRKILGRRHNNLICQGLCRAVSESTCIQFRANFNSSGHHFKPIPSPVPPIPCQFRVHVPQFRSIASTAIRTMQHLIQLLFVLFCNYTQLKWGFSGVNLIPWITL